LFLGSGSSFGSKNVPDTKGDRLPTELGGNNWTQSLDLTTHSSKVSALSFAMSLSSDRLCVYMRVR
jgi:hypothetical protein